MPKPIMRNDDSEFLLSGIVNAVLKVSKYGIFGPYVSGLYFDTFHAVQRIQEECQKSKNTK